MTFRRVFSWVIGLPVAAIVIAFCVANREWISVSFDPVHRDAPWATIAMPQWVLFFAGIFFGLIVGWISAWFNQGKWRKAAREHRAQIRRQEAELARLEHQREAHLPAGSP